MKMLKIILYVGCLKYMVNCGSVGDSWINFAVETKGILKSCSQKNSSAFKCIEQSSLKLFDKIASHDIIPIMNNVRLIKYTNYDESSSGNKNISNSKAYGVLYDSKHILNEEKWSEHVLKKITDILKTHVLQVDLPPIDGEDKVTSRHRRRNQMLPMMVFGITAFGMFVVPMGFQFLAVLGGKALLLAKMALLLASVNGLKRVATSGVNYGLYHEVSQIPYPHPPPHSHYGYYDRDGNEGPRFFAKQ